MTRALEAVPTPEVMPVDLQRRRFSALTGPETVTPVQAPVLRRTLQQVLLRKIQRQRPTAAPFSRTHGTRPCQPDSVPNPSPSDEARYGPESARAIRP